MHTARDVPKENLNHNSTERYAMLCIALSNEQVRRTAGGRNANPRSCCSVLIDAS